MGKQNRHCCSPICSYSGPLTAEGERVLVRLPKKPSEVLKYLKCSDDFIAKHKNGTKLYACQCHFETVGTAAKKSAVFVFFNCDSERRAGDPTYQLGCKWFRNDVDPGHQQKRKSIDSCEERCENRSLLVLKKAYEHQDPVELGKQIQDYQKRFTMIIFS